jgi:hypothetical protein
VGIISAAASIPDELVDGEFLADCQTLADDSVTLEQVHAALAKTPGSMAEQRRSYGGIAPIKLDYSE